MPKVGGQLGGQCVNRVTHTLVTVIAIGESRVDGGEQWVDMTMLLLHRIEHGQVVRAVGEMLAHSWPQICILCRVVVMQLRLENRPSGEHGVSFGRIIQLDGWAARRPSKMCEVASECCVYREHDRQVDAVADSVHAAGGGACFTRRIRSAVGVGRHRCLPKAEFAGRLAQEVTHYSGRHWLMGRVLEISVHLQRRPGAYPVARPYPPFGPRSIRTD